MNFETILRSELIADIGWALFHSLWQIGLVSIALFLISALLRGYSANVRYVISVSALALAVMLPALTLVQLANRTEAGTASEVDSGTVYRRRTPPSPGQGDAAVIDSQDQTSNNLYTPATDRVANIIGWIDGVAPDVLPFAVFAWVLGVAFFSLRLGGGLSQLRVYKTSSAGEPDKYWVDVFERLCEASGVRHAIGFLRSDLVRTPIAVGVLKPVIIVPAGLFLQINPQELETIIMHELIHIRRYDPLVNVAQCIVESVLFYHPGIWWISTQIRREREFAADEAVTCIFEDSHVTYARALANLEEIRLRANQNMPRYATAANGGNFMQRIQRILKIKTEESSASSAWTAGMAFVLTSVFLLAVFSFSSSDVVNAQQRSSSGRKLAIGFVSIPPVDRTSNAPKDADATARLLIQELKEHKVPAIGFLQGGMVSDGEKLFPVRANIARMWIEAGFEMGLGGFKHVWLYHTAVDDYIANIEKNEQVAKKLVGDTGFTPRYFSYPFLNTGKTAEDKAKVESWLASRGYTSVKYTIDNSEWMYSYAYDMARNDNDVNTMKEIRESYLAYMSKMFDHYEAYSAEMFGRDIPQTLVLTPSRLVTDTADDFFAMVEKRGYSFVTVNEAQSDAAYKTKEDFAGDAGISWFERWAMAKGQRLRKEPEVDSAVQQTWNEKKATAKK